ncbi:YheC/YheD family protein [Legionella cardiaca]|uniref:Tubulin-tyrosine ligase n=1 Tax=Legionella cardiaca TaxID=1071983 RepID=A0ABY8AQX9_9GAMM|nr:YheC/YheD family protein [Legionella cardiaca]WED43099.1 tubulin-tyrosine ligase [Legionella cardiaca]
MLKFLKGQHLHFSLKPNQSPTHYNLHRYLKVLGWHPSRFKWQVDFGDRNLQFHLAAAQCLEFKHLLAQLTNKYCPEVMPLTYCVNDTNWPLVLEQIADNHYLRAEDYYNQVDNLVWILKPALLNNGKEIKIFEKLSQLEAHFLSSERLGGEHVLQQYITEPHLLRPPEGHKYSIRMFVVLTNYAGVYLYPRGYFNVALHPFQGKQFTDLRSHLTNEHLHDEEENVVQIPSWRFDFFTSFYPEIKAIIAATIKGLQQQYPQAFVCSRNPTLAIFGFDFMVDKNQRIWLLEANHGPCFPVGDEHPLQKYLYYDFWQAFITSFVLPIASQKPLEFSHDELFDLI